MIIGTAIGVLKVRPVRSFTNVGDQWKALRLFEVAGVPWCPVPGRDGAGLKSHVRMATEFGDKMRHGEEGQSQPYVVRAVKLSKEDIKNYGMTQGSPAAQRPTETRQQ